MNENNPKIS